MVGTAPPTSRRWPFAFFVIFLLAYNLFRVGLFAMTQNGTVTPEHPLDPLVNSIVVYSELAIGVVGLIAVLALVRSWAWGFWLTLAINVYAIVFDGVAAVGVQLSAVGGILPPVVILLGLLLFRGRFFQRHATEGGRQSTPGSAAKP